MEKHNDSFINCNFSLYLELLFIVLTLLINFMYVIVCREQAGADVLCSAVCQELAVIYDQPFELYSNDYDACDLDPLSP